MAEFEIEADRYKSIKLNPKLQMRVLKRLARIAPAIKGAGPVLDRLKGGARPNINEMAEILTPVITAFADMADDDVDFIIDTSLDHTYQFVRDSQNWRKVRDNGVVSNHKNIELVRSVMIAFYVLRDNFEETFRSLMASASVSTEPEAVAARTRVETFT